MLYKLYSEDVRVLNFVKQVFFLLSTKGSLVDTRAYLALHLGGTPSQETGTSPLAVNSSTTVYTCHQFPIWNPDTSSKLEYLATYYFS